ncbi:hypothetical protein [Streptomyces daghestanicus]|uniref:Secreted protein n=1 Tax=Streptomyces daghestanicus TaxID=66885 RepID=A0ABQ3QCH2_9ACTN|nr:hypothetical protein [Streptomyces daghestanicus]GGU55726.1 hypothetical protein GCM10010259_53590 [Streptomyces daghestanicus]GHI34939.1 hypothetical protein Sdagh_66690 [Streptomyces daghestanicus]
MAHPVLALGAALLTAAGCVWYLPALAELRAGADRPDSRRDRAAACLTGWGTLAGVAVLLPAAGSWWPAAGAAEAGSLLTAALLVRAAVRRRRERRETVRAWTALTRRRPPARPPRHPRYRCAALLGTGLAASAGAALALAGTGRPGAACLVPAALTGLTLLLAAGRAHPAR